MKSRLIFATLVVAAGLSSKSFLLGVAHAESGGGPEVQNDSETLITAEDEASVAESIGTEASSSKVSAETLELRVFLESVQDFVAHSEEYQNRLKSSLLTTEARVSEQAVALKPYQDWLKSGSAADLRPVSELKKAYGLVNPLWRSLVDEVFGLLESDQTRRPPEPPEWSGELPALTEDERERVIGATAQLNESNQNNLEIRNSIQKQKKELIYDQLLRVGKVRAFFYNQLQASGESGFRFDEGYLSDLIREVTVVPYRALAFAVTKSNEFKLKMSGGLPGFLSILKQILIFIFVCSIPVFVYVLTRRLAHSLDEFRRFIFTQSSLGYHWRSRIAIWIGRLTPYLSWILMILATHVAENLIAQTDLTEVGGLLPYIRIYLWYRVFRLVATGVFSSIALTGRLQKIKAEQDKAQRSARRIGILVFAEFFVLYVTEDVVRRAIIYGLVSNFIFYFNIFFFALEFQRWKLEVDQLGEKLLPHTLEKFLDRIENRVTRFFVTPIKAIFLVVLKVWSETLTWLGQFDVFKQLSSELLRRRLEDSRGDIKPPSQSRSVHEEYTTRFLSGPCTDPKLWIASKRNNTSELKALIELWADGKVSDDAFVIHGEKGAGKTSLILRLQAELPLVRHVMIEVPPKVHSAENFLTLIAEKLATELSSAEDVMRYDQGISKTVIYFDEAQNLFLNQLGGFEAYHLLQNLISLQTENIFWIPVFNQKSWRFLQGVFGLDHLALHELPLRPWSDEEIHHLIMRRHEQSGYTMRFDSVIRAVRREEDPFSEGEELESQFFRLLWGQSRGNPRVAMALWLTALRMRGSGRALVVGIPEFPKSSVYAGSSDEMLFIYASLFRHENLSAHELQKVTSLAETSVKKALKMGEDSGALHADPRGRYRVSPLAQHILSNLLTEKNFLYE